MTLSGEAPTHRVVYQLNQGDAEYQTRVLFSVGAMLRNYGDDIKQRIRSLNEYGAEFHACGNSI